MLSNPSVRRLALLAPALDSLASPEARRAAADFVRDVGELLPDVELVVVSFDAPDVLDAPDVVAGAGARVIRASDRGALLAAAFASDVVVLGPLQLSGGSPADAGDDAFIGARAVGLPFAAGLACIAAIAGRPLWVLGASVPEIADSSGEALGRVVCDLAEYVGVADEAPELRAPTSAPEWSPTTVALVERLEPAVRRQLWVRQLELERQVESRARAVEQRDEEIARLRGEMALGNAERRGRVATETELAEIKSSRAWRTLDRYRLLRGRARAFRERRPWHPPPVALPEPLDASPAPVAPRATKHDVVCFSIIDWESRWQRPQQLASKFADNGHRVFYVRMSGFLPPGGRPYEVTELRDNVWAVKVATRVHPQVYEQPIAPAITAEFIDALAALRADHDVNLAVSLVQIPTWRPIAESVREHFGWRLVYDCMDEWSGFPGVAESVVDEEADLARSADAVVVSAQRLLEKFSALDRPAVLARNAADFERFAQAEGTGELDGAGRPVLGYFGVIDEWFDIELVVRLARARPDATIVLIGPAEVDVGVLERLPNVQLLGLRPYSEMPGYLAQFDVCLIPFRINETTAAADQVKFYEYISRGKPVVSTLLPELEPYREHLYLAADHDEFLAGVDAAAVEDDADRRARRVDLARANDWQARYETIEQVIAETLEMLSVVVVTYGNRALTEQCIERLLLNTSQPRFELIVVDNASDDGTPEYLRACAAADDRVRLVLNPENRGFAAAVNQGLKITRGDVLVIMNNDVVVPRAWHVPMLRHLERPDVGLVTATTNNAGNEARVAITYADLDEMEVFAAARRHARDGSSFDVLVAVMYCVAMRREVFDTIGPLDERFGIGWFEDDDYSHRARLAGYRVICADDAFVHHHGQAAFATLAPDHHQSLWHENQLRFEEKWGMAWEPPERRLD